MQIPNTNAEIMPPKLWSAPNNNDEAKSEKMTGVINLNLFNKTPLKINSSTIGEMTTVEINVPRRGKLPAIDIEGIENSTRNCKVGKYPIRAFVKYSIPYEKKILVNTIIKIYFN